MNLEHIDGMPIFRPRHHSELAVRTDAERNLRSVFAPAIYADRDSVNRILQHQFAFYDSLLKSLLPQIASRHFMEFVLTQYDQSVELHVKHSKLLLSTEASSRWAALGPQFRRAAKYLAEATCMLAPSEAPEASEESLLDLTDRCWICCEELVRLSSLSTQTFAVFPDDTLLEIRPEGELDYLILQLRNPDKYEPFAARVRMDTASRKNFVDETDLVYNRSRIASILDGPFKADCGFSMTDALSFGFTLNGNTVQPGSGFDVPFVHEHQLIDGIRRALSVSEETARRLLDGIALRRATMASENRVVWKPKQEYRAFARALFEFPHPSGTHFVWSRRMLEECLMQLYTRLVQKHIPPEWQVGNVMGSLEAYSSSITHSFEDTVIANMRQLNIPAGRFGTGIGQGTHRLEIPPKIGEIDCLGYVAKEQLLIVGDCKLVKPTHEPATFRDDLDKFLDKKGNYVDQILRKTQWVKDNAPAVSAALQSVPGFADNISVKHVAPVLITYYPAFASCFFDHVPCVSLSEFAIAVKRFDGGWPFPQVMNVS